VGIDNNQIGQNWIKSHAALIGCGIKNHFAGVAHCRRNARRNRAAAGAGKLVVHEREGKQPA